MQAGSNFARPRTGWLGSALVLALAVLNSPMAFALISQLQQPVLRVVPLVAGRTLQITAPACAFGIVAFGDREGRATTARYEIHS